MSERSKQNKQEENKNKNLRNKSDTRKKLFKSAERIILIKMLSGIASYFFGASEETVDQQQQQEQEKQKLETRLQTRCADDADWIIVDQSSSKNGEFLDSILLAVVTCST